MQSKKAHRARNTKAVTNGDPTIDFPFEQAFISHAYSDEMDVENLLTLMPSSFVPILFPVIKVVPQEYVSSPIIDAIRNAPALIFLESAASRDSFWVNFERNVAFDFGVPVYAWNADTGSLRAVRGIHPLMRAPAILPLHASREAAVTDEILQWAQDKRGFQIERFTAHSMTDYVIELQEFEGAYVAFASRDTVSQVSTWDVENKFDQDKFPRLIVACLDDPRGGWIPRRWRRFMQPGRGVSVVDLTDRGKITPYSRNRVDDLIVRIHWVVFKVRTTVMQGCYQPDYG